MAALAEHPLEDDENWSNEQVDQEHGAWGNLCKEVTQLMVRRHHERAFVRVNVVVEHLLV